MHMKFSKTESYVAFKRMGKVGYILFISFSPLIRFAHNHNKINLQLFLHFLKYFNEIQSENNRQSMESRKNENKIRKEAWAQQNNENPTFRNSNFSTYDVFMGCENSTKVENLMEEEATEMDLFLDHQESAFLNKQKPERFSGMSPAGGRIMHFNAPQMGETSNADRHINKTDSTFTRNFKKDYEGTGIESDEEELIFSRCQVPLIPTGGNNDPANQSGAVGLDLDCPEYMDYEFNFVDETLPKKKAGGFNSTITPFDFQGLTNEVSKIRQKVMKSLRRGNP